MSFDFTKTLALIKGGLTDHEATWKGYLQDCPNWQATAISLTGPLILANIVLGVIFGRMLGGYAPYGYYSNFLSAILWGLILACFGFIIAVFVFNYMAGVFKGKSNFQRAFAAVTLAAIPSWLAGIVAALVPGFIGIFVALAGGILSLVFMYKIMPLALEVPDEKRIVHFIVSIVIIIVLNIIAGGIFGGAAIATNPGSFATSTPFSQSNSHSSQSNSRSSQANTGSGVFGEIERQGRLMEAADADRYEPPEDGKLTFTQVVGFTRVLKKTKALHADYTKEVEAFSKEMEEKEARGETPSIADMSKDYSGIGSAFSANNAEMEIVKSAGGNWAEHNWVRSQLRTAYIQQGEGSEEIEHNYKLYDKYREEIGKL